MLAQPAHLLVIYIRGFFFPPTKKPWFDKLFCWLFFFLSRKSVGINLNDNYFSTNTFNCNLQLFFFLKKFFICAISIAEDPMLHSRVWFWQEALLAFWLLE